MNAELSAVVARLGQIEPSSDEALGLVLDGRALTDGARSSLRNRFATAENQVLACWAASIANAALRGTPNVTADAAEEARAEAGIWMLEQLAEFRRDGGGSAGAFLRSRQSWFRSALRRGASPGLATKGSYKVAGAAGDQRQRLIQQLGREPTREELRDAAAAQLAAQTAEKLRESEPKLKGRALNDAVTRRLDKDGINRALNEFTQVQVAAQSAVYLDGLADPDALAGAVAGPADGVRDTEAEFERLMRVALGDQQWARTALSVKGGEKPAGVETEPASVTYQALVDESGRSAQEIKAVLRAARARIRAPHAQWAHCADEVRIAG